MEWSETFLAYDFYTLEMCEYQPTTFFYVKISLSVFFGLLLPNIFITTCK